MDEHGTFREENFTTAMAVLQNAGDASKGDQKGRKGGMKEGSNCFKIVKMIMERNFAPVIIFSFSKKECEAYALQMAKLDFNTPEEKKLVDEVFQNAMMVLSEEDRGLPQVENVLPLLRRGIGIHHGGLLPILKETIEIMFGEGLLKALFATETFAMVNIYSFGKVDINESDCLRASTCQPGRSSSHLRKSLTEKIFDLLPLASLFRCPGVREEEVWMTRE